MSKNLINDKTLLIQQMLDEQFFDSDIKDNIAELLLDIRILSDAMDVALKTINTQFTEKKFQWVKDIIKKSGKLPKNANVCTLYSIATVNKDNAIIEGKVTNITERGIGIKTSDSHLFVKWCNVIEIK